MVPNGSGSRGGYGDYLRTEDLYKNWIPNNMGGTVIPAGSDQDVYKRQGKRSRAGAR